MTPNLDVFPSLGLSLTSGRLHTRQLTFLHWPRPLMSQGHHAPRPHSHGQRCGNYPPSPITLCHLLKHEYSSTIKNNHFLKFFFLGGGGAGNMAHKPVQFLLSDLLEISDMHLYNFMISFRRKTKTWRRRKKSMCEMLLVFVMSNELHWAEIGISQEIKWHPGITHRSNSLFVLSDNIPLFNKLCFYVQGFVMLGLDAISFLSHWMHSLCTGNLLPKFKILFWNIFWLSRETVSSNWIQLPDTHTVLHFSFNFFWFLWMIVWS